MKESYKKTNLYDKDNDGNMITDKRHYEYISNIGRENLENNKNTV